MGLRIRKSVKLAPGVRLNVGKNSSSVSVGGHGVSYTTKLHDGTKEAKPAPRWIGCLFFWLFVGWWWWPLRLLFYDLPKYIIKRIKEKKLEA